MECERRKGSNASAHGFEPLLKSLEYVAIRCHLLRTYYEYPHQAQKSHLLLKSQNLKFI
jgi:hypothetical protein